MYRLAIAFLFVASLFMCAGADTVASPAPGPSWCGRANENDGVVAVAQLRPTDDTISSWGTGVAIAQHDGVYEILTDDHVVTPPNDQTTVLYVIPCTGKPSLATRVSESGQAQMDLAIITTQSDAKIPIMRISSTNPDVLHPFVYEGFPENLAVVGVDDESQMHVANLHLATAGSTVYSVIGDAFIAFQESVDSGTSGGPLYDGDVVYGLVRYTIAYGQSDPALTAPSNSIATSAAVINAFRAGQKKATTFFSDTHAHLTSARMPDRRLSAREQNLLGVMLRDGAPGITANDAQAERYFELAAARGNADAENNLGLMSLASKNDAGALHYFQLAASQRNAEATSNLGYMYQYGRGVAVNYSTALRYFKDAAALGSATGEANLGFLYANGLGVQRDDKAALEAFQRSASHGSSFGLSNLGWMYDPGRHSEGISGDYQASLRYYRQSVRLTGKAIFYDPSFGGSRTGMSLASPIRVGKSPDQAAMTPDGREVYVTNTGSDTVSVIDTTSSHVTRSVAVGESPGPIVMSRDGRYAYVASANGEVDVIATATKTVEKIATGFGQLADLAVTPDGRRLFLAPVYSGLAVVDLSTRHIETVSDTTCPEGLAIPRDGGRLFVSYQCSGPGGRPGHDAVGVFALSANEPCTSENTSGCRFTKSITGFPNVGGRVALSPDGSQLWLNGIDACSQPAYDHTGCYMVPGDVLNVINTATSQVMKTIVFRPGGGNDKISFSPNGAIVLIGGGQFLKIMDWKHVAFLQPLPFSAGRAAFTPDGSRAFIPVTDKDEVVIARMR